MTKPTRLSLIAILCRQMGRGSVRAPLAALPAEIREEVKLAKAHDDDESIVDVETVVHDVSPELAAVIEPSGRASRVRADDSILTPAERRQAALDLAAERRRWWLVPLFQPSEQTEQTQTQQTA